MLSFLELTEEDCFRHVYIFHPCDVVSLVQLHLKKDGLLLDRLAVLRTSSFDMWSSPFDAKDGAQAALVKPFQ